MKFSAFLLPVFAAALLASQPVFADTTDSALACALPEPEPNGGPVPDTGFDLGDIVALDVASNANYTASVMPTVQLDFDYGDEVVNLTNGNGGRTLTFSDSSRDGYRAYDYAKLEGGLGAQLGWAFGNSTGLAPSLWATVGLMPLKGGAVEAQRFYANRSSLDDRDNIPSAARALKALETMRAHDVLSYDTYGGIVFWASAGYGFLINVAGVGLAQGDFTIRLEKIDADHVYVKITDANVKAFGLQVGNIVSQLAFTEFSRYSNGLGFSINIHDRMGQKAYYDLIRGNVAPIQKLAQAGNPAVRAFDEMQLSRVGSSSRIWAGIPLLFSYTWSKSRYYDVLRDRYYACGRSLHATHGTFFSRREGSAFGVAQQNTKAFYGTAYTLNSAAKGSRPISRGYFGELVWSYRGNYTKPDTFRRAMEKLGADTGLGEQLELDVPDDITERLEFTSLTLRARFSAKHVLRMVERARSLDVAQVASMATALARTYFASGVNPSLVCEAAKIAEAKEAPTGEACVTEVVSRTSSGADRMMSAIATMNGALKRGDERRATRAFAEFGEAMLTNQFTLQTGLRLAGADLPVDYVVEGSDFYRYQSLMKTVGTTGRLVRDSRSPLFKERTGRGPRGTDSLRVAPELSMAQ